MKEYCFLSTEQVTIPGEFRESQIVSQSGREWHLEADFMHELAAFVMARYESQPSGPRLILTSLAREGPTKTKQFYRRLFDSEGNVTDEFAVWASECLALWVEQELEASIHAEAGPPHNSDPAFDIICITQDQEDCVGLRIVQVKQTDRGLQRNANQASAKFGRLERGYYDAELAARLELIAVKTNLPLDLDLRDLIFESKRQYKLTAIHGEDRAPLRIMTKFNQDIPGDKERRSACLMRVEWSKFWSALGEIIYAQLL